MALGSDTTIKFKNDDQYQQLLSDLLPIVIDNDSGDQKVHSTPYSGDCLLDLSVFANKYKVFLVASSFHAVFLVHSDMVITGMLFVF